jgi:hypothetical protein
VFKPNRSEGARNGALAEPLDSPQSLCSSQIRARGAKNPFWAPQPRALRSFALAEDLDEGPVSAHAAVALATVLLETGHADRSAELLVTRAGGDELRLIGGGWRARYLELLTRCYLEAGRRVEAERAARAAQVCADTVNLPMASAMARLAAGALAFDAEQPTRAAAEAIAAAAVLESVGDVFDAAMARSLAGRALAQAGERDGQSLSLNGRRRHSIRLARTATGRRQTANCENFGNTFTDEHVPEWSTESAQQC